MSRVAFFFRFHTQPHTAQWKAKVCRETQNERERERESARKQPRKYWQSKTACDCNVEYEESKEFLFCCHFVVFVLVFCCRCVFDNILQKLKKEKKELIKHEHIILFNGKPHQKTSYEQNKRAKKHFVLPHAEYQQIYYCVLNIKQLAVNSIGIFFLTMIKYE